MSDETESPTETQTEQLPVKMSVDRFCAVHGGPECKQLATAKTELARVESAIKGDSNPRIHNLISAKRRIAKLQNKIETLIK